MTNSVPVAAADNSVVSEAFSPYQALAARLLPFAIEQTDGSHDVAHLRRVWKNAFAIQTIEGGDAEILAAAVLLHDCVAVEKSSPLRAQASRLAAEKAQRILGDLGWNGERAAAVAHAIRAHSFSAGVQAETLEARILRDADRLDAIGMVGVARCFYTAGRMNSELYDQADPDAKDRPYDDRRYALDHFYTKLLKLAGGFETATGAHLARKRDERLRRFLAEFRDEL